MFTRSVFIIAVVSQLAFAHSEGAPSGVSGAPGDDTCVVCHGGRPNSGSGKIRIEFADTAYTPGQKYRIKVTVEDPAALRWGFELSARTEKNSQTTAGTLATVDNQTQILNESPLQWITHTSAGTKRGQRTSGSFEFDWTAPSSDVGPVILYAAGNAANNNANSTGDLIYTTSLKLPANAGGGTRPAFSSTSVTDIWTGQSGVAPGGWATITGTDLAKTVANWMPQGSKPIDTTLGGVVVKFNGIPAVLSLVSPTKIMALVPAETPTGDIPVVVERDGQPGDTVSVPCRAQRPAIYAVPDPANPGGPYSAVVLPAGAGFGLALVNPKGSMLGNASLDARVVRGAYPGEEIDILATGLGAVQPDAANVRFGELSVPASGFAAAGPGLYAVRVKLPDSLAPGTVPLMLEVAGVTSGSNVLLNVDKP